MFCLTLEQSVKSTLPHQPQPIPTTSPVTEKKRSCGSTSRHASSHPHRYTVEETKKRSATANYCPVGSKKQKSQHHHSRKRRPLSLPPPDNVPTGGQDSERRKRKTGTLDAGNQDESMNHESHHRSRCHSNGHHCRRKNCSHNRAKFITLGQLKDLGLALNTKENDGSQSNDHHKSLRRSITSPHNLEQLCYLGPERVNGRTDDEQDSSASNMAVADYDVSSTPVLPAPPPPPIPLTFKVKHLHKHSHYHVVHHTTDLMPDVSSGNRERHYHQSLVLAQGTSQ